MRQNDIYQAVTTQIIDQLEKGVAPWETTVGWCWRRDANERGERPSVPWRQHANTLDGG